MDFLPNAGDLLQKLMSSTPDSIYFKDRQSRFILMNHACASKHGFVSPEQGIGMSDFDTFAPEHAEKAFVDEQDIIRTGIPIQNAEEREVWPDGHITWCSTTKMPLRDEDGTIIGVFGITRDITARKEAGIRAQQYAEQVRRIKEEMEDDARMAGDLQKNFSLTACPIFTEKTRPHESCIEFSHRFWSGHQVSGDFCRIKRISDTQAGIFICDVAGRGARAALGAALIRGIMQEIESLETDPSAYVGRMNELLFPLLHPGHLLLDVSVCYMVVDVCNGLTRLVSAGHPQPLHFRPGYPVKWLYENLVFRGPRLAAAPDSKYRAVECRLAPQDSVLLFTDGLFTAVNQQGEPFSEKRLLQTARDLDGDSLEEVIQGLEDRVHEFSGEKDYQNDVCLVGFHLRRLLESS